jgi:hypothetical protein
MATLIQFRRDSSSQWTAENPVLAEGELGLELDTGLYKIGDGATAWNSLNYSELGGTFDALALNATTDPAAPASGLTVYAKEIGGRVLPKFIGPSGLDSPLQPAIFGNGVSIALPGLSTALSYVGMAAFTAVGTLSHPALAANSLRESTRRGSVVSAATAGSASELRLAATQAWRGNGAGLGGFFASFRWGISSAVATARSAVGLWAATTATSATAEPSSIVNGIWVGNDAADANLQLMRNDGSGSATKIDLGSNFVKNQQNAIYELVLFCKPNDTRISYRVKRLDAAGEASGEITTDLPASTTFLAPHMYVNNGGTAAAVTIDVYRYYLESDY